MPDSPVEQFLSMRFSPSFFRLVSCDFGTTSNETRRLLRQSKAFSFSTACTNESVYHERLNVLDRCAGIETRTKKPSRSLSWPENKMGWKAVLFPMLVDNYIKQKNHMCVRNIGSGNGNEGCKKSMLVNARSTIASTPKGKTKNILSTKFNFVKSVKKHNDHWTRRLLVSPVVILLLNKS